MLDRETDTRLRRLENQVAALAHYQILQFELLKSLVRSEELTNKIDSYILSLRTLKKTS